MDSSHRFQPDPGAFPRDRSDAMADPGLLCRLLDTLAIATFVVAPSTRLILHNAAAEALLAESGWLDLSDGCLALRNSVPTLGAMLRAGSQDGETRRIVPPAGAGGPELVASRMATDGDWLIVAHEPAAVPPALRARYGLTQAEATLAAALRDGTPPAGVAARLGVSTNTVKSQAKALYAKLGVSRQSELVWRLTSAPERLLWPLARPGAGDVLPVPAEMDAREGRRCRSGMGLCERTGSGTPGSPRARGRASVG